MFAHKSLLLFAILIACCVSTFGCRKQTIRGNIVQSPTLDDKGMIQRVQARQMTMMSEVECGIPLESASVNYLEYVHNGELVQVLWGPRCRSAELGAIVLLCDGDIRVISGFAYVHISQTVQGAGAGNDPATTAPAPSQTEVGPRPWLKTTRVRTTGVGSTWAIEVDPDSGTVKDRIYFIDGSYVISLSEATGNPPADPLDDPTKETFLTYTLSSGFTNEAKISSNSAARNFASCVTPYACIWGLPAPNPCP